MGKSKTVLLGVTASIAAYKACDLIRRLQENGYTVKVIMTKDAEQFITPLTLGALSGQRVNQDMFQLPGEAWSDSHIGLAQEADALLIAPATANILGKIANGIADNLLTCVAMATQAPIVLAPAMNTGMYKNKIVQDNIAKVKKYGMHVVYPTTGKLACGVHGAGRLAETNDIISTVKMVLKK